MTFSSILTFISHQPPLLNFLLGVFLLVVVGFTNWYGDIKVRSVQWIGKKICLPVFGTEDGADGVFMTITGFLLAIGGVWVIYSLLFLTRGT